MLNIEEKKEGLFTKIARFIKYNKILVLFSFFILLLIYMYFLGSSGFIKRLKLEKDKKELEKQIETEKRKQDSLEKKIIEIQTSEQEIERIAREKYGMTKEGEKIYKIYIDSTK